MTPGMLEARVQFLRRLRVLPERTCDIMMACVVLHSVATIRGEQRPLLPPHERDNLTPTPKDGTVVRDQIWFNHF